MPGSHGNKVIFRDLFDSSCESSVKWKLPYIYLNCSLDFKKMAEQNEAYYIRCHGVNLSNGFAGEFLQF